MSTTKNGVAHKITRGKEENITEGEVSKTLLPNWDGRLEIVDNRHKVVIKVRWRDDEGKGNNKQQRVELKTRKRQGREYDQGKIGKIQL